MTTRPIIIIGGGFAGLRAALDLDRRYGHDLTTPIFLIDASPDHIYTPSLYDIVSTRIPRIATIPFESILENTHIRFIQERVVVVDIDAKQVTTERRRLKYEDLVIAIGSLTRPIETKHDETEDILSCQTIEDVLAIRTRIEDCFVRASQHPNAPCHNHFFIAGGGLTGVEFAAGLNQYIKSSAERHGVSAKGVMVTVLEAGDRLVPSLSPKVSRMVQAMLKKEGVTVCLNTKMTWKNYKQLKVDGESLPLKTVIWTVGSKPGRLVSTIKGLRHDEEGRVLVDGSLQAAGAPRVWIAGDAASVINSGLADTAVDHGRHIAKAIEAVRDVQVAPGYHPHEPAVIVTLSSHYGIAASEKRIVDSTLVVWYKRIKTLQYFSSIVPMIYALRIWLGRGRVLKEGGKLCYKTVPLKGS
jgi:NADH dehydrogenase